MVVLPARTWSRFSLTLLALLAPLTACGDETTGGSDDEIGDSEGTEDETDASTTAETGESGMESSSEDTDSSSEETTDTTDESTDTTDEGTDTTDDGEMFDCLDVQFASGENPGPDYTGLDVVVGSHCLGTNHQDIADIERVVFLGDSVTVGTPPAAPEDYYRSILADEL